MSVFGNVYSDVGLVVAVLALSLPVAVSARPGAGEEVRTTSDARFIAQGESGTISGTVSASSARHLANTLVYLEEVAGEYGPPAEPLELGQRNMTFEPFLLPVFQGTTVHYLNSDSAEHNVYSPDGEGYDLGTWGQGESRDHTFDTLGVYTQLCHIHPQMIAYVVVLQNPYYAVVGEDGSFQIDGVPPGTYSVAVWNERKEAAAQPVTVEAGASAEGLTFELQ